MKPALIIFSLALSSCLPITHATKIPTNFPTKRTRTPSTSPTTSRPSHTPTTSKPSFHPTTSQPSTHPTTSRPSRTPTTSRPSRTPTSSPSTSPSHSPSRHPTHHPSTSPSHTPTQTPSANPTSSPTRRCVVRLGMVYSMTGPLQSDQPRAGLTLAIAKLNSGDWTSGQRAPGFVFNYRVQGCVFEPVYMDDKSDPVLHVQLTAALAPAVDVLIEGGTISSDAVRQATVVAQQQRKIMLLCCSPSSVAYSTTNPYVFGVAGESTEYTHLLVLHLALYSPQPHIGIIYDSSDVFQTESCQAAIMWMQQSQMSVAFLQPVNVSTTSNFTDWLSLQMPNYTASGSNVMLACVGLEQAKEVSKLFFQSAQNALYVTTGPGIESFDTLVTSDGLAITDYVLSTTPWVETMPWNDPLFGNSTTFTAAFRAYNPELQVPPNANAVAVASLVFLIHNALVTAGVGTTVHQIQDYLRDSYEGLVQAMRQTNTPTIYGPVRFDTSGRNIFSESVATVQLQSSVTTSVPVPLAVLPLQYAQNVMIYPAPTKPYCEAELDTPSVFDEFNSSGLVGVQYPENVLTECKSWERDVRLGNINIINHNMSNAACTTCNPLYAESQCDDSSDTYSLSLFPSIQVSACAGPDSQNGLARCSRWFSNSVGHTSRASLACTYVTYSSGSGVFSIFILCLGAVICLGFGGVVFWYRESQAIKFAQYHLLMVFVMGGAAICLCGIVFVGPPTAALCQLRTWLFNVSVSITLTPLFLKVWRVWMLFENPKLKHIVITDKTLGKMTACVLLVELIWLAIWTGVSPTQPMCTQQLLAGLPTPIPVVKCSNTQIVFPIVAAVLLGLQILSCLVLSFLARKVSVVFAEREVGLAALNITVVGAVVSFVFFFTDSSESIKIPLVCFALAWCSSFSVALLVAPKVYWIYHLTEEEVHSLAFIKKKTSTPGSSHNAGGGGDAASAAAAIRRFESGISGNTKPGGGNNDNTMENLSRDAIQRMSLLEAQNAMLQKKIDELTRGGGGGEPVLSDEIQEADQITEV